jgi:hypothetical protein
MLVRTWKGVALLRCKKDMGKPLISIFEIAYRSNIEF